MRYVRMSTETLDLILRKLGKEIERRFGEFTYDGKKYGVELKSDFHTHRFFKTNPIARRIMDTFDIPDNIENAEIIFEIDHNLPPEIIMVETELPYVYQMRERNRK